MRGNGGFTFVEIIVAMTIFALVLTMISTLYIAGYASYAKENQRIEVQENLRYALNRMSRNLRQARSVSVAVYDGDQLQTGEKTRGNKIVFDMDGVPPPDYEYEYKGATLYENSQPLASFVTGFSVEFDRPSKTVALEVYGEKGKSGRVSMSTTVYLRVP